MPKASARISRRRTWKDRDVKRLVRIARDQGLDPAAIEVDVASGHVKIWTAAKSEQSNNPWLDEIAKIEKLNKQ